MWSRYYSIFLFLESRFRSPLDCYLRATTSTHDIDTRRDNINIRDPTDELETSRGELEVQFQSHSQCNDWNILSKQTPKSKVQERLPT
ncbi:hypothetical protein CYMTET_42155 [Cymbomonas tetramitiformis]|uniref:Uncharacterized protein n=1 Tax=Cymbomonas tetramitiformis TaxID=36881 RepID=A0AAE0C5Z1_9CHLO|nr:hypothetical protein CYMTET_42155 [Cymbomonas tetramitiformis]